MTKYLLALLTLAAVAHADTTVPCRTGTYDIAGTCLTGPPRYDVCAHRCQGGINAGLGCDADANCPGSTCAFAHGDGVTDDTTAIQTTITAAAVHGRGHVYFPCGTYKITSTLVLATVNGSGVQIQGESSGCVQITTANDIPMLQIGTYILNGDNWDWSVNATSSIKQVEVSGIHFRSSHNIGTNTVGLVVRGSWWGNFHDLLVSAVGETSEMSGIAVYPASEFNTFNNISNFYPSNIQDSIGYLITLHGDAPPAGTCPFAPGQYCANYNSAHNIYSNLDAFWFRHALFYATGPAFGDMILTNIHAVGTHGSTACLWFQGINVQYAYQINIAQMVCDGYQPNGILAQGVQGFSFVGGNIHDATGGGAPINAPGSHYVAAYVPYGSAGVFVAQ